MYLLLLKHIMYYTSKACNRFLAIKWRYIDIIYHMYYLNTGHPMVTYPENNPGQV